MFFKYIVVLTTFFNHNQYSSNKYEIFLQACLVSSTIHQFTNCIVFTSTQICHEQKSNSHAQKPLLYGQIGAGAFETEKS